MTLDIAIATFDFFVGLMYIMLLGFHQQKAKIELLFRAGLWVLGLGLIAQSVRTISTAIIGHDVLSFDFPIWFLKDLGAGILLVPIMLQLRNSNTWCKYRSGEKCLNVNTTHPLKKHPKS